jgi:hypothetical protein
MILMREYKKSMGKHRKSHYKWKFNDKIIKLNAGFPVIDGIASICLIENFGE